MEAYVARQPILNRQQQVFAYELLFRTGSENYYQYSDGDKATADVITNSFGVIGIDTLTGGKRGFINFTEAALKNEIPSILPRELIGVEILEDVEPDEEVIASCKKLKQAGYLLVLDDFVFHNRFQPLINLADIIKVDFCSTSSAEIYSLLDKIKGHDIKLLAEKVETREDFQWAYENGFSYFQGYYFSKPVIVKGKNIPANKITCLQLLKEINQTDDSLSFDHIEDLIKRDVSLSYQLLRYINSAAFGFRHRVQSIKQVLVYLGTRELKKWVSLYALRGLGTDKPEVLLMTSVVRARFCETMGPLIGLSHKSFDLFLLGLLSMIDAFLDRSKEEILAELPVEPEVRDALLSHQGKMSHLLSLLVAYEKGEWDDFDDGVAKLDVDENQVPNIFFQSVQWANQIFDAQ